MRYPTLYAKQRSQQSVDVFAGYNHNLRINESEFYDMLNLTSDLAPVLAPRKARGIYVEYGDIQGMIAKDSLCYVDGRNLVINDYRVDMNLSTSPKDCPKQLISMGAYVIIMPDKKYFNTADFSDYGNIEADISTASDVRFIPCMIDGTEYTAEYIQSEEPAGGSNMAMWIDTSAQPHTLKQYSSSTGMWANVETTYVKIQSAGIGKSFSQYDGVKIEGLKGELVSAGTGNVLTDTSQLEALEGNFVVYAKGDDYICVIGILDSPVAISNQITVSRRMPAMDFVIESQNRLWGCRYGLNNEGEIVNELYCSKLGDFRNWNCFMGISTDSYIASLGSDGPFIGAITYAGHPLFWKENYLHDVYGQIPANFQVQTTACRGVQKGSERSLAIANEILYYKARHGLCSYDGSVPTDISAALGEERYCDAVAAAHGNKYYVSMKKADGTGCVLMVLDTAKGLWHKEDDLRAKLFCSCRDELYCATEDGKILTMLGSGDAYERQVSWMAETGIIGASLPGNKYLVKMNIRMLLEPESTVSIEAQYDSTGNWECLGSLVGMNLRSFTIPVRPRRCDHLRLRAQGKGKCMIFSITKTLSYGSDIS